MPALTWWVVGNEALGPGCLGRVQVLGELAGQLRKVCRSRIQVSLRV